MRRRTTTKKQRTCFRGHPQGSLWSPTAGCARCAEIAAAKPKKPKRPPPKRPTCRAGHPQSMQWRAVDGCAACELARHRANNEDRGREDREAWSAANPCPPVLSMLVVTTGRVIRHSIPSHLRKPKRKARGPGRRRRI